MSGTELPLYQDSEVYAVGGSDNESRIDTVPVNDRVNVEGSFQLPHDDGTDETVTVKIVFRSDDGGMVIANARNTRAQRDDNGRHYFSCQLDGPRTPGDYSLQVTVDDGVLNESALTVQ